MEFFDSLIEDVKKEISFSPFREFDYDASSPWEDVGYNQIVLQRDTAFELDGTGFDIFTSLHIDDGITVVGEDLRDIKESRSFARVSVIELDDVNDEQKAYSLIRKIEYTKYHYFPEGYMIRSSARAHKENIRVSHGALKKGISFQKIGNLLINKYKENSMVKGVRVFFVTEKAVNYNALENIAKRNNDIIKTLNHVINTINFDCDTCNLKPICDEVEGMRELHFKNKKGM